MGDGEYIFFILSAFFPKDFTSLFLGLPVSMIFLVTQFSFVRSCLFLVSGSQATLPNYKIKLPLSLCSNLPLFYVTLRINLGLPVV